MVISMAVNLIAFRFAAFLACRVFFWGPLLTISEATSPIRATRASPYCVQLSRRGHLFRVRARARVRVRVRVGARVRVGVGARVRVRVRVPTV